MKHGSYLPDEQSFRSGLPEGKSILNCKSHIGVTRREQESGKKARNQQRVRERSHADREGQGKAKK